jgi:hypothetical protein
LAGKPIIIFKLTPAQIDLVERLAGNDGRAEMGDLSYGEVTAFQELQKLGFADLQVGRRQKLWVSLTDEGKKVRKAGYFSKRPVLRVTEPQINLLRFLDDGPPEDSTGRHFSEIPATMIDVCRRMSLRGWVDWYEGWNGGHWAKLTLDGREILLALDATQQ